MNRRTEFSEVVGLSDRVPEVSNLLGRYEMNDVYDDPPLRKYLGSKANSICILFEEGRVIDVQIYLAPTKLYSSFQNPPLGLERGMTQEQVHKLLGPPFKCDEFDSKYELQAGVILTVAYSSDGMARYLSIGAPV